MCCLSPGDLPDPGIDPYLLQLLHCRWILYQRAIRKARFFLFSAPKSLKLLAVPLPEARLESGKSRLALSRATWAAKTEENGREEAGDKRHPRYLTSGKYGGPSVGSSSRGSAVLLPGEEGGRHRGKKGCGQRERVSRASDITEQARQLHILLDIQHSLWLPIPQRKSDTSALEEMAKYECRSKPQAIQQQLQMTTTGNKRASLVTQW